MTLHFSAAGALTGELPKQRYGALTQQIDAAILLESARWGDYRRSDPPYRRDPEWLAERDWLLTTYFPQRTQVVLDQFRSAGLLVD